MTVVAPTGTHWPLLPGHKHACVCVRYSPQPKRKPPLIYPPPYGLAPQVLKTPNLVSSVFFMCLPDKVGVCEGGGEGLASRLSIG